MAVIKKYDIDIKAVEAKLSSIQKKIEELKKNVVTLGIDTAPLDAAQAKLTEIGKTPIANVENIQTANTVLEQLSGTIDSATGASKAMVEAQKQGLAVQKDYTAEVNKANAAQEKRSDIKIQRGANLEYEKGVTSIRDMRTILSGYTAELEGMQRGTEAYATQQAKVNELTTDLKEAEKEVQNFRRGVGDYEGSIGRASEKTLGLRERVRLLREQLIELELAGKGNSKEYDETARELGTLTDAMDRASAITRDYANDTRVLANGLEVLKFGVNVYSLIQSGAVVLGVEGENLQRTMTKLIAVQGLLNTVQKINVQLNDDASIVYRMINKLKQLFTRQTQAQTAAMTAEGAATTGATVATTAFKKALISTGIGAFIVLIGSLVAYWDEVVSFFKKFATGAEDVKLSKAAVAALNGELDEYFGRQERFGIITSSAEKVKAAFTGMVEAFDKADKSKKNWGSLEMQPALEAVKNIKTLQDGYNVINKFGDILDEDLTQKIEQWAKYAKEHNDVLIEIDKDNEKSLSTGKRQIAANKEFNKAIAGTGISIKTTADAQKLYDDVRRGDVSLTTKQTLSLNKFIESIKTHTAEIAKLQKERDKDTNSAKKNADSIVERVDEIKSKIDEVAKSNEVKLKLGLALDTTSIPELRKMLEEMNEGGAGIDIKIKTDTGTARAELNKVIADEVAGWTNADKIKIESAKQVTVEKEIQAAEQEKLNEQMAIDDYNRWKQEQQLAKETADIIKKYNEQKAADEQEAFNATTGVASDSMKAIADLMEEGSAEAKAFTIASMITDTIQASFAAYKATVGIPIVGPALAPIAAATAAAAGAAAIKKIGGSAPAGDTATAASTPRATTPTTDQSLAGQYYLAGGIRDQRVVILASDIEDALNDRKVTTTN